MATRRQNMKDLQNKQAQARESYAKNKSLMGECGVIEKEPLQHHKPGKKAE